MCLSLGNNPLFNITIYEHLVIGNVQIFGFFKSPIQLSYEVLGFCQADEEADEWKPLRLTEDQPLAVGPCLVVLQGSVWHAWAPLVSICTASDCVELASEADPALGI